MRESWCDPHIHPKRKPTKTKQRPDVTAIWRSLLLPPTGPGGRSNSNRKIHAPRAAATTSGSSIGSTGGKKGVSPSPLYILVSQQSACGMLLRSLDDSLRRLVELVDRLPSPTPAVLPASLLSQTYLWHLSAPSTTTTAQWGQAPHLAGAVHLATLHAVRLEMGPAAGTGTGAGGALGNGTHVAGGASGFGGWWFGGVGSLDFCIFNRAQTRSSTPSRPAPR